IQATRQWAEPLGLENFTNCCRAQPNAPGLERIADLVDRVVTLAELDNGGACRGLFRLRSGARLGRHEELRMAIAAKVVTHDLERSRRVAKGASDLRGSTVLDEEGAKCLVLPLLGSPGLDKEATAFAYRLRCADRHVATLIP